MLSTHTTPVSQLVKTCCPQHLPISTTPGRARAVQMGTPEQKKSSGCSELRLAAAEASAARDIRHERPLEFLPLAEDSLSALHERAGSLAIGRVGVVMSALFSLLSFRSFLSPRARDELIMRDEEEQNRREGGRKVRKGRRGSTLRQWTGHRHLQHGLEFVGFPVHAQRGEVLVALEEHDFVGRLWACHHAVCQGGGLVGLDPVAESSVRTRPE